MFGLQTINLLFNSSILPKLITRTTCANQLRNYAKDMPMGMGKLKKVKKVGSQQEKIVLPVETDAKKLVSFVCGSNILKEGQDVAIKPDSEYPDWLWNIRLGPPPPLSELDPNTKQYWRRVRQLKIMDKNKRKAYLRF